MIVYQSSYWVRFIFRLAGIFVLVFFFSWLRIELFDQNPVSLDEEVCKAEQRVYNRATQAEDFAKTEMELAFNMLILAIAGGAIFGTNLGSKREVAPAITGVLACVVAGFVGGLCALALFDPAPHSARNKLLRVGALFVMMFALHYSSVLRSPIPELVTAKRELRKKQQQTADAYLLFDSCREKHGQLSEEVEE